MEKYELQKLRDLPIEGGAERLGLRVTRHHCLCPFHDDTHPSLSFLVRKNSFKCFVCGKSGGTIDLVMGVLHLDFLDACRWLANEHNVVLNQWKPHEKPQTTKPFDAARYEREIEALEKDFFFLVQDMAAANCLNGELVNRKFDKGLGVRRVCEALGFDIADTVGFGDSMNDLEMIETVGTSVCMANGSPNLQKKSDIVCPAVEEDGLAKAFKDLGLC